MKKLIKRTNKNHIKAHRIKKIALPILYISIFIILLQIIIATLPAEDGRWKMDESSGNALDSSGNGNTLINNGGATYSIGKIGNAITFDGTNGLNKSSFSQVNFEKGNFTISVWVKSTDSNGVIVQNRDSSFLGGWIFGIGDPTGGGNAGKLHWEASSTSITSTSLINDNDWHNVVVRRNGTAVKLFIDGVQNASGTDLNNYTAGTFDVGKHSSGGGVPSASLIGSIDDLRVFKDKVLTDSNILSIFTGKNVNIVLDSPLDNIINTNSSMIFNATLDSDSSLNLTNATLNVWFSNGTLFNQTTNLVTGTGINTISWNVSLVLDTFSWNVFGCAVNSTSFAFCNWSPSNFTFSSVVEEFDPTVLEGETINNNLNITFVGIDTDILAHLNWNNTIISPTKDIIDTNTVRFTTSFVVPQGTGTANGNNISHFWRFWLPDNSLNLTTTSKNQTVFTLGIDDCSTNTNLLFNYSVSDEESLTGLNFDASNTTNTSIGLTLDISSISDPTISFNFNKTYDVNPAQVCVTNNTISSKGFRIDAQARYFSTSRVVEFNNIQNASLSADSFPQQIPLYDLKTTDSQEFLIEFKDENFLPVQDALISINRKYVGEGLFRTVEAPLTDVDGQALAHLVLGDVIYTIIVYKHGVVLGTFDNRIAFCEDLTTGNCRINLNSLSSGTEPLDFTNLNGLSHTFSFNEGTRTITATFSTIGGSIATINLTGIVFDGRGNITACSSQVDTSSGSLNCVVPDSIGNVTISANLFKDGSFVNRAFFTIRGKTPSQSFGLTGLMLASILFMTIPLMFITTGVGIVFGAIIGLIFAGLLNLYSGGSIIGLSSTIIWFIIAGGIIVWKITQKEN